MSAWEVYDGAAPSQAGVRVLSRHASARGQGQVVLGASADSRRSAATTDCRKRALICNFPGGKAGDPGLMQYSRCGDVLPRIRPPDARVLGGQQRVGRHQRHRHRGRFRRGSVADAGGVLPRSAAAGDASPNTIETGEPIPAELVAEDESRRGLWASGLGADAALLHHAIRWMTHTRIRRHSISMRSSSSRLRSASCPTPGSTATACTRSFTHLIGYSSNYYTYLYDKVIALDFFSQFTAPISWTTRHR